jgi:hypothetical protein
MHTKAGMLPGLLPARLDSQALQFTLILVVRTITPGRRGARQHADVWTGLGGCCIRVPGGISVNSAQLEPRRIGSA